MSAMSRLYRFIATSGICSVTGAIAGSFVGGVFGLVQFVTPNLSLPLLALLGLGVGLSLIAWLVVLIIVGVLGNYGVMAIASRAFVTTFITGVLTVLIVYATRAGIMGLLIGWIIGFLVGKALCALCGSLTGRAG